MRVRWRGLELPSRVSKNESISTDMYGQFVIEPFERGFGTTVGNSLRRILLSSLEGAAVVSAKVKGAQHEFSSLPGVLEDVADIILNVKQIVLTLDADEPKVLKYTRSKSGEIKARDCQIDPSIEIVNPDLVLATLTDDVAFEMELEIDKGRGYVTADERRDASDEEMQEVGIIPIDAVYSPVIRVRYKTEDTRVGQKVNYDRLVLEVWTKGTVSPEMAVVEAAKILRKHLNPFVQYFELGEQVTNEVGESPSETDGVDEDLLAKLNMNIAELDLSVRAGNCLESAQIGVVGELAQMTEADLLKVRSFGKTSLREVKRKLSDLGLSLGMELGEYRQHLRSTPRPSEAANVE